MISQCVSMLAASLRASLTLNIRFFTRNRDKSPKCVSIWTSVVNHCALTQLECTVDLTAVCVCVCVNTADEVTSAATHTAAPAGHHVELQRAAAF